MDILTIGNRIFFFILLALLFCFPGVGTAADESSVRLSDGTIKFAHPINLNTELKYGFIQDRDGFFWIGTLSSGLIRYDGYDFKYFTKGPDSISGNSIQSIIEDKDGDLWIATNGGGLNRYDKGTNTFTHYRHDPKNTNSISSDAFDLEAQTLLEDKNGNLWIGTVDGLDRFEKNKGIFTRYRNDPSDPESLVNNHIRSLHESRDGSLWVGTDGGLCRFDMKKRRFIRYTHDPGNRNSLPDNKILSTIEDSKGRVWIGTRGGALSRFIPETQTFTHFVNDPNNPESLPQMHVQNIRELNSGELYLGPLAESVGLVIFDPEAERFTRYSHDPKDSESISSNSIVNIYEDRTGIIWVLNLVGRIDKYDKKAQKFTVYRNIPDNPNSLNDNVVLPIHEDLTDPGILWIGTLSGGLSKYDRRTQIWKHFRHNPADESTIRNPYVVSIFESRNGSFWVGTFGGLCRFNRVEGACTRQYPEITRVYTIIEDYRDADILWIGTMGGMYKLNMKNDTVLGFKNIPQDSNSLSDDKILWYSIIQDKNDHEILWIATAGGGVNKFNTRTQRFARYTNIPGDPVTIASNFIYSMYEDNRSANIWICTAGGLSFFDKGSGKFKNYSSKINDFPAETTYKLMIDNMGNLWISANTGLIKFDPVTENAKLFTKEEGARLFLTASSLATSDGKMWFGGASDGMICFDPEKITENDVIPPVFLTSIKQSGEDFPAQSALERLKEITLDWHNNFFEFEFAALNYTLPEKNRYRYILEGHDKGWYNSGTRRFGRYTALPGGTYTLRIRGSNNDGIWNNEGVSLKITVLAPFWKTWWFYLICTMGLLGFIGFIFHSQLRARTNRLKAEQEAALLAAAEREKEAAEAAKEAAEREKEAAEAASQAKSDFLANMSHEIRTPMNAILGFSEIMKGKVKDAQLTHYLESIHSSGKSLLKLINDILDLSKVEAGKLRLEYTAVSPQKLFNEMENIFGRKIRDKGLELIIDIPATLPETLLLDEIRLRQILLNLIGNAIKFTEEGSVRLAVNYHYPENTQHSTLDFIFSVEDTGMGIPEDQLESIFSAFTQIKGQKTSQFGGTGLGLAITKRLIEMMNGKISVKSDVGKGSAFRILLKDVEISSVESMASQQNKKIDLASIRFENSTILITDDIEFNRELLRCFLEDYDFTLLEAENGREAIEKAGEYHPDLILMDMEMPEMNGYEAVAILKKDEKLKEIPVVAVTASAMKKDEEIIKKLCDSYLKKPVSKTDLIAEVMKFLSYTRIKTEPAGSVPGLKEGTEVRMIPPPAEEMEVLHDLAMRGNMNGILKQADRLEHLNKQYFNFAGKLRELAKGYLDDELLIFIRQYLEKPDDHDR